MQTPEKHKEYLRRRDFVLGCANIAVFSDTEREILRRYGCWMQALAAGVIAPVTPAEERFLLVDRGQIKPESQFEFAWMKLKNRREYERKYSGTEHYKYFEPAEVWFPRHENWRYK